jgi:multicomponent Na+:H+ antiporter subunit F
MTMMDLLRLVTVIDVVYLILGLSVTLAMIRLIRGPFLPDRVVALDLITMVTVGFIVVYGTATGEPVFLDAAIAVALVAFGGTVAFARYLERRARGE